MFGSSSPFGASTPSLFGGASPSSSPFGASTSTSPFGMNASANPFGAKPFGSTTTFGQTGSSLFSSGAASSTFSASQPAPFGSTTPAFGATPTASPFGSSQPQPAFGSGNSVFGQQKPAPFGTFGTPQTPQSSPFGTPVFGQQTQSAFGAQQSPTFGAASTSMPTFGTSTSAFGAPSAPSFSNPFQGSAFGGASTSVFGQSASAFGQSATAPAFTTTPAFGQPTQSFGIFGQPSTPAFSTPSRGTRAAPYVPKADTEGSQAVKLLSISAMDQYKDKSIEELRWEDYQAGDKGGAATGGNTLFSSNPFPTMQPAATAPNPFSSTPSPSPFQKPLSPFSTTTTTSSFGTGAANSGTSIFGTSSGFMSSTTSTNLTTPAPSFQFSSTPAPTTPSFSFSQPAATSSLFNNLQFPSTSNAFSTGTPSLFNAPTQPRPPQAMPVFPSFPFSTGSQPSMTGTPNIFSPSPISPQPTYTMPVNNTMAPTPGPVNAPFGTLPAMPQMSIGRPSGSSPSVQYGISTMPLSEKPAQVRSSSLLTPRHITPRSKIRMHARRTTSKKDSPKVSFFSDGEDAPVTPKADVSFIPRENPRALFIHQTEPSHVTPVAVKPDGVPDVEPKTYPAVDDDFLPKESPAPVREEHSHRGNGYISMSGHRAGEAAIAYEHGADIEALMPKLKHSDYYTEPRIQELAAKERGEPGYCRRVPDFVVGRKGFGHIKFWGETDVRRLDIEGIIQFNKCEVLVYMDESKKPPLGQGLNKAAEVTLLNVKCIDKKTGECFTDGAEVERFGRKLKKKTEDQGAEFISYDPSKGEWTFRVKHFSRYGLDESDDESVVDAAPVALLTDMMVEEELQDGVVEDAVEVAEEVEILEDEPWHFRASSAKAALPHTLPAQLRLNPTKMQLLKTSFFPAGEEEAEEAVAFTGQCQKRSGTSTLPKTVDSKAGVRPAKQMRVSPFATWQRSPLQASPSFRPPLKIQEQQQQHVSSACVKPGFRLEEEHHHISVDNSTSIADAALFMGASFRVGWGPHGIFVHSGAPVGQRNRPVSSSICFERVALDRTARDEQGKVKEGLLNYQFVSPLSLHLAFSQPVVPESRTLTLRSFSCTRTQLQKICDDYEDLIEKQHNASGLSSADHLVLRHQVMTWQLISVLFSEKLTQQQEADDSASESMAEMKARIANIDPETGLLIRRADFSSWLQDSVFHLVQADLDAMKDNSCMREILTLLTGKQVAVAVEKAILEGDVRLACLLSQAAGSVMNRQDMIEQVEVWESEGIDEELMDNDRLSVFKVLGGDIRGYKNEEIGVLAGQRLDWKRFLGLLMWYGLPPEAELANVINEFRQLVEQEGAPSPIPMYLEEGGGPVQEGTYDSAYYLMLLHASGGPEDVNIKGMLSSASSTFDYLDHRTSWHQKAVLQAIGVLKTDDLNVLDMSFVFQLLAAGLIHWAVYVVLHIPESSENPNFHEKIIKEIIGQYCEVWSSSTTQRNFLANELGIPSAWLHEALAVYWNYCNNPVKGLEHLLMSGWWQEAHVLFMTKVSASLFLNLEHGELWTLASRMEEHKMEIDSWDLGAGLYIDFLTLKGSLHDAEMESRMCSSKNFFNRLKESRKIWEGRASNLLKMAFARMADEVASLIVDVSKRKEAELCEVETFATALEAPVPEDVQLCRLQGAVATFVSRISQGVC